MLTALFLALWSLSARSAAEGPFQDLTLDQALVAAKHDKKVVMIDFFTTWCGPCKKLDKVTWSDPAVQKWLAEKTVPLRFDAEKEVDLAKKFEVSAYPTMIFLTAEGTKLDQIVGFVKPEEFLSLAQDALAGKTSTVRTNEKLARLKEDLVGHENSPMAREHYADALADAARYEEALAEYLWCFDNGNKSPSYVGVRLSFLLGHISRLGENYPPAIKALEDRRDAAESRLSSGSKLPSDVSEAVALNRELKATKRILDLYDHLRRAGPLSAQLRTVFAPDVLGPLVEARRYQDAIGLFDNPEGYVTWQIKMSRSMPKMGDDKDGEMRDAEEQAQRMLCDRAVSDSAPMYEALLGAGKKDMAAKVADDLIEFVPSGHTYSTLIASAVRAQTNDVAQALADRGLSSLPEKEKKAVQRAAKKIPTPK